MATDDFVAGFVASPCSAAFEFETSIGEALPVLAGEDGALRLSLALADETVAGLNDFEVTAGTLAARGGGELQPGTADFSALRFEEVSFHGTALRGASVERVGEVLVIATNAT